MTTVKLPMDEWKNIPWRRIERNVFKLQKRIYQASLKDDRRTVQVWIVLPDRRLIGGRSHPTTYTTWKECEGEPAIASPPLS